MREIQAELDMPTEEFERKLLAKLRAEVDQKRKKLEGDLHVEVQQTKARMILQAVSMVCWLVLGGWEGSSLLREL